MKTKLSFISDLIFVSVITFILALVAFNYFIPRPYSLIYSTLVSLLALIIFFAKSRAKRTATHIKKQEQKQMQALTSELSFSDRAEQNALLEKALKNAGYAPERKRGAIILKNENALILCRFSFNKINKADIVRAFNLITKAQTAYILAQGFDNEVKSFAERFDGKVILVGEEKVFKFIKENDAMPKELKYQSFAERKSKGSFKNLLDKKKAKTFFIFGALFLLFSYISPLKVYYIVCGCLFLVYSLILKLVGKDMKINTAEMDNI